VALATAALLLFGSGWADRADSRSASAPPDAVRAPAEDERSEGAESAVAPPAVAKPLDEGSLSEKSVDERPAARALVEPALVEPAQVDPGDVELGDVELGDDALTALFSLEPRVELSSCAERVATLPEPHGGKHFERSLAQLRAARQALVRGNQDEAYTLLCSATAHCIANPPAWLDLAQLSLQLGDAQRATWAIDQSTQVTAASPALIGLRGDVAARLGDLDRARALWRQSAVVAGQSPSDDRLIERFVAAADRQLRAFDAAGALSQYRRAAVLSAGGEAASRGMSTALGRLRQSSAERAWTERVQRTFPKR
jgi:hypothetical protein